MARLTRRVERLESQQAAAAGCRDPFHVRWHPIPFGAPAPTCPSCGTLASRVVILACSQDLWNDL